MQKENTEKSKKTAKPQMAIRLKTLRAEYGLTQAQVAEKLGVSQQTYSKYENSDVPIDSEVLRKLCALYGVSADYILAIEQPKKQAGVKRLSVEEDDIDLIVNRVLSKIDRKKK